MKHVWGTLCAGILLAVGVQAAETPVEMPTDAQIKAFSETYKAPDKEYVLQAQFMLARLFPAALRQYAETGKVPFRITLAVFEKVMSGGEANYFAVMEGAGNIVIVDETNTPVLRKAVDLDLLCPS